MHGRKRNAEEYRDQWIETSNELNLLVVVPEFSNKDFPEVWGFNYGNVKTKTLVPVQKNLHAFSAIEPIVLEALKKFNLKSNFQIKRFTLLVCSRFLAQASVTAVVYLTFRIYFFIDHDPYSRL